MRSATQLTILGMGLLAVLGVGIAGAADPVVRPPVGPRPTMPEPGRYIAFDSDRPGGAGSLDIYLYDRKTRALVPLPGINSAGVDCQASISLNARYILFRSDRPVPGRSPGISVFLFDRTTGSMVDLPNLNTGQYNYTGAITPDGRYIAFSTSCRPDCVGRSDIYLYDRNAGDVVPLPGINSGDYDAEPSISADGRYIAFSRTEVTSAGSLIKGRIRLYDRNTKGFVRLPGLRDEGNCRAPSLSADGRYIAFHSEAPNNPGQYDIQLYDRQTSALVPLPGLNSDRIDGYASLSADGRFIAFLSHRQYTAENKNAIDIYLYDRQTSSLVPLPGLNSDASDEVPSIR